MQWQILGGVPASSDPFQHLGMIYPDVPSIFSSPFQGSILLSSICPFQFLLAVAASLALVDIIWSSPICINV